MRYASIWLGPQLAHVPCAVDPIVVSSFPPMRPMVKLTGMKEGFAIGLLGLVLLTGCQSKPSVTSSGLDNSGFMSLWETYRACQVASDLDQASSGLEKLSAATQLRAGDEGFVLPLPSSIERLVSSPTNRLAVDVRAMTAACSLHTGQLALYQGRVDTAREMFSSILALQQDLSPYYILQAKKYLTELEQGLDLALQTP